MALTRCSIAVWVVSSELDLHPGPFRNVRTHARNATPREDPCVTQHRLPRLLPALLIGGLLGAAACTPHAWAAPAASSPAAPAALAAATPRSVTLGREASRIRSVKTPRADWFACAGTYQCATVRLPRDYDQPKGAKVEIAMVKVAAAEPDKRIGTLFVNPGGPGGSGVSLALAARGFLPQEVLDRYDVIGFDPRGVGFSTLVKCFPSLKEQTRALGSGLAVAFPVTPAEIAAYQKSSANEARGCSDYGKALSGAVSTSEVARDMEMLRRMVGDKKLHYLGFSYGTFLGETYAALFPDRVGRMAIDGVIDPTAWVGTASTASTPITTRLRSGQGAWKALQEGMRRCTAAGPEYCATLAYDADALHGFESAAQQLKDQPLSDLGLDYASFVNMSLGLLYYPFGAELVDKLTAEVLAYNATPAATKATAGAALRKTLQAVQKRTQHLLGFPYDNGLDQYASVLCTDGRNPSSPSAWVTAAQQDATSAPYFGAAWTWSSPWCATKNWTSKDEDVYRGDFRVRTSEPVLVIGNYYDPATNYDNAVAAAQILSGARLLSSDSWGHTATGSSACVDDALAAYLVEGTLPAADTVCKGDYQLFTTPIESGEPTAKQAAEQRNRVPINSLVPRHGSLAGV